MKEKSIIIVNDTNGSVLQIIPTTPDKSEEAFLEACKVHVSDWNEHTVEDVEAITEDGFYSTVSGKYLTIIHLDNDGGYN